MTDKIIRARYSFYNINAHIVWRPRSRKVQSSCIRTAGHISEERTKRYIDACQGFEQAIFGVWYTIDMTEQNVMGRTLNLKLDMPLEVAQRTIQEWLVVCNYVSQVAFE